MEQKQPHKATTKRSPDGSRIQYRLYFLQGVERRISYSHEFEAKNDEEALRTAEAWREGRPAELWTGSRRIKSWEAER